jgi:serine protease Do
MPGLLKTKMNAIRFAAICGLAAAVLSAGSPAVARQSSALDLARQLNEAFVTVAEKVSPAVVVIHIRQKVNGNEGSFWDILPPELRRRFQNQGGAQRSRPYWMEGEGSGIVISADGYILTNNHVVEDADQITVRLKDGRTFEGEVKGADSKSDIAVIKINATGLTPAKLGDSDATRVGEFVLAIGAPFELSDTVTVGHVSAKGRSFGEMGPDLDQDFLQTDAKILPGNSGGPLVNLYGEVIGVNTMIEGLDTGIGFAVPINLARRVKDHLIAEGRFARSRLDIHITDLKHYRDYLNLDGKLAPDAQEGVVVTSILPDGAAAKSDLRPGDVITAVDGKSVKTVQQLRDEVADKKPGSATRLDLVRGKEHLAINVTPQAAPGVAGLAAKTHRFQSPAEPAALGLTVTGLTKDLASQYGVDLTSGVIVTAVEPDLPAYQRGVKAGDVITAVNRRQVSTPQQFRDAVKSADLKSGVMLNLISDGESRFLVLKQSDPN